RPVGLLVHAGPHALFAPPVLGLVLAPDGLVDPAARRGRARRLLRRRPGKSIGLWRWRDARGVAVDLARRTADRGRAEPRGRRVVADGTGTGARFSRGA